MASLVLTVAPKNAIVKLSSSALNLRKEVYHNFTGSQIKCRNS